MGTNGPRGVHGHLKTQSKAIELLEDLDRDRRTAYTSVNLLQDELHKRNTDNDALKVYLKKEIEETERLEMELEAERARFAEHSIVLQEEVRFKDDEIRALKERNVELAARLDSKEIQYSETMDALHGARVSLAQQEARVKELEQCEANLEGELRNRENELQELIDSFRQESKAVRRTIKGMDMECLHDKELRLKCQQELDHVTQELQETKQRLSATLDEVSALTRRAETAEAEIPRLSHLVEKLESTLAIQSDQLKQTAERLKVAEEDLEQASEQVKELTVTLNGRQQELALLQSQLPALQEEAREAREQAEDYKRKAEENAIEAAAAERRAEEAERRGLSVSDESRVLAERAEVDRVRYRSQLEGELSKQASEKEQQRRHIEDLQRELSALMQQKEELIRIARDKDDLHRSEMGKREERNLDLLRQLRETDAIRAEVARLASRLETSAEALQQERALSARLQADIEQKDMMLRSTKDALRQLESESRTRAFEMDRQLESVQAGSAATMTELQRQLRRAELEAIAKEGDVQTLKERMAERDSQLVQAHRAIAELEAIEAKYLHTMRVVGKLPAEYRRMVSCVHMQCSAVRSVLCVP
eukprot:Sspe_Gene.78127::Locus_48867_Transcript_1_1_Confidence_1.000_Length_1893::g.78127::m.78127